MLSKNRASSADALWLHMEHPTNLMYVTGLMVFDGPVDAARVKAALNNRLLRFRRFRQQVVKDRLRPGGYVFKDYPGMNIDAHITPIGLPRPGDQESLKQFINKLISTPLDMTRPLWDVHLIDNYEGDNTVFCIRIHHAIADGIALIYVMLSTLEKEADARETAVEEAAAHSSGKPGLWRAISHPALQMFHRTRKITASMLDMGLDMAMNPKNLLKMARTGGSFITALARLLSYGPDTKTVLQGPLGVAKKVEWSEDIPVEDIKAIGRGAEATVNDVLLCMFSGAIRRYLQFRGEDVDHIEIRVMVPVALRSLQKSANLGNFFGTVTLSLPINLADPWERLKTLKSRMDALKLSPEALITLTSMALVGLTPKDAASKIVEVFNKSISAVVTNVPGPREPLYFIGKPVKKIMVWAPIGGRLGLGSSIFSYAGKVTLGLFCDAGLVPDPERIAQGFMAEFEEMKGASLRDE